MSEPRPRIFKIRPAHQAGEDWFELVAPAPHVDAEIAVKTFTATRMADVLQVDARDLEFEVIEVDPTTEQGGPLQLWRAELHLEVVPRQVPSAPAARQVYAIGWEGNAQSGYPLEDCISAHTPEEAALDLAREWFMAESKSLLDEDDLVLVRSAGRLHRIRVTPRLVFDVETVEVRDA